jgi:predicted ferric reductase
VTGRRLAREVGPVTIVVLAIAYGLLWLLARPAGVAVGSYVGQWFGAESVLLLSVALVLISTLPWVEEWFDGIDRAAIWHRRVAMVGLVLLLPHILLSSSDGGSGKLLGTVGLLGLFVAAGVAHGLLDGTPFGGSPLLRWSLVAIGGIGLAFYAYRELLARFFVSLRDYQVQQVRPMGPGLVEISLRPLGRPMTFVPGQFAMIYLEGKDGWHRHPFTIASAPTEGIIRVTVKALGDYTSKLSAIVERGMPAVIGGPHGRFFHSRGTDRQIWIAGGVGVAPFLSWLRALDQFPLRQVDFFYSNDGPAPFAEEIATIASLHKNLHVHVVDTRVDGRLTTDQILDAVEGDRRALSVFMCGPAPMLRTFQTGLRSAGVPIHRIHREHFDWR